MSNGTKLVTKALPCNAVNTSTYLFSKLQRHLSPDSILVGYYAPNSRKQPKNPRSLHIAHPMSIFLQYLHGFTE